MNLKFEILLEDLFKKSLSGDSDSYRKFLNELTRWLRKILAGRVYNNADLEDVVQDIIIAIHKAKHTYDSERRLMPWLQAIISFRFKDYLRSYYAQNKHQRVTIDDNFDIEDENYVTEEPAISEDINKAIEKLKDKQKEVLKLMYFQELSVRQVAEKLKMSESAVKVTAHRAYKILREKLEKMA